MNKLGGASKLRRKLTDDIFSPVVGLLAAKSEDEFEHKKLDLLASYEEECPDYVSYFQKMCENIQSKVFRPASTIDFVPLNFTSRFRHLI